MDRRTLVSELKLWFEKNIDHINRIDEIALKSGYTKWHLQRLFQLETGKTLGSYIRERRLQMASEALIHTNQSIIEISILYGFSSQQVFTRAFKKQFKHTPAKYRKIHTELVTALNSVLNKPQPSPEKINSS